MLAPETRALLTDALRPPSGYRVDIAVATTYSLDLNALLLAPMSFALHDYDAHELERLDPIKLLESVRRHAGHTTVFCQAGAIRVPSSYRSVLTFAEESVHEVMPPAAGRVFHPKVWVIRFADESGRHLHRFLCMSRNLTFDQSWDTLLRVDEEEGPTAVRYPDTLPLVRFVSALPGLATTPLSESRHDQITSLTESLAKARFAPPTGIEEMSFLPLGLDNATVPTWKPADRILAVSAFLDVATVRTLAQLAPEGILLSRPESLDRVGAHALGPLSPHVLQRSAETDVGDSIDAATVAVTESSPIPDGLHAKTFVFERGPRATVLTGSANATRAGFAGNVEFDVILQGPRESCGVGAVWDGTPESPGLSRLTQSYLPPASPTADAATAQCEWDIGRFHAALAASGLQINVTEVADERFLLQLTVGAVEQVGQTRIWPITLPRETFARPLEPAGGASWGPVGVRSITPFLAVETTAGGSEMRCTVTSVIKAPLVGDPPDRRHDAMRDVLRSKLDVLRYLIFLLGDPAYEQWFGPWDGGEPRGGFDGPIGARVDLAVFEPLVRAAANADASLERVASLLHELQAMQNTDRLVPDGFQEVWHAVWQAHEETQR